MQKVLRQRFRRREGCPRSTLARAPPARAKRLLGGPGRACRRLDGRCPRLWRRPTWVGSRGAAQENRAHARRCGRATSRTRQRIVIKSGRTLSRKTCSWSYGAKGHRVSIGFGDTAKRRAGRRAPARDGPCIYRRTGDDSSATRMRSDTSVRRVSYIHLHLHIHIHDHELLHNDLQHLLHLQRDVRGNREIEGEGIEVEETGGRCLRPGVRLIGLSCLFYRCNTSGI